MTELTTLARPYAAAVFQYALEHEDDPVGGLEAWQQRLAILAAVIDDERVRALLSSRRLGRSEKAAVILDLCRDDFDDASRNFVRLLADNGRLDLVGDIYVLFDAMKAEHESAIDVAVISAYALDADQVARLQAALAARFERQVAFTTAVDPSLIGGLVIRAGDTVIDSSVRGRIGKLAEAVRS